MKGFIAALFLLVVAVNCCLSVSEKQFHPFGSNNDADWERDDMEHQELDDSVSKRGLNAAQCSLTVVSPPDLPNTGGTVVDGAQNVNIICSCTDDRGRQIRMLRWFDPDGNQLRIERNTSAGNPRLEIAGRGRRSSLIIPQFGDQFDGNYTCSPLSSNTPSVTIPLNLQDLTGEFCFNSSDCGSALIGTSTSFIQCCGDLTGLSYNVNGQCIRCPRLECEIGAIDVVFVLDVSGSIGPQRFQIVREFAANESAALKFSSPQSAAGVILFDGVANIYFNLNAHSSIDTLLPAINPGLPYRGGGTNTHIALNLLLSAAQDGTLGLRAGTRNVTVVVTDGQSSTPSATVASAQALHAANLYEVYAVGVSGANIAELEEIASDPSLVFFERNFTDSTFRLLQDRVLEQLCKAVPTCALIVENPAGSSADSIPDGTMDVNISCSCFDGDRMTVGRLRWFDPNGNRIVRENNAASGAPYIELVDKGRKVALVIPRISASQAGQYTCQPANGITPRGMITLGVLQP